MSMEGRLRFIVVVVILILVIITGRNILIKKTGIKSKKVESPPAVITKKIPPPVKVVVEEKKIEKTESAFPPEKEAPAEEESPEGPVQAALPAPEEKKEIEKLPIDLVEVEAGSPLCEGPWEKNFCPRLKSVLMSARGARKAENKLMIVVDNSSYLGRAQAYANPPSDPSKPAEESSGKKLGPEQNRTLAGAILLREILVNFKEDLKGQNLVMVFMKNPSAPVSYETFAYECIDGPLQSLAVDTTLSEERIRSLDVDFSNVCRKI